MVKINSIIFGLILAIGIICRFIYLDKFPASLNWDEISHGYNAYSVLNTGKDQWGASWPIFNFRAYGDYPTTLNLYLTIPFIKLFGLNAFSIRLPAAILGVIFIYLSYLFAKIIFKKENIALITMLLTSISPWTIFPSRGVFQSNLSQVLFLLGLYLFFKAINQSKYIYLSFISFGLSMYAYHNTRIAVIPTVLILIIFYFKKISKTHLILASLIFLTLAVPNAINLFSPSSLARNRWVGIINPNSINLINEERRVFSGPPLIGIMLHNKVTVFIKTISVNYLNLLNPIPIFIKGSQNFQFNPPNTGLIYLVFAPFFYLGLYILIKESFRDPKYLLLSVIFLIALLPAALTVGDFPSIRATLAVPFYFVLISLGLTSVKISRQKLFRAILLVIIAIHFINYAYTYYQYTQNHSDTWQYGYQETVDYIKQNYSKYDKIIISKKYGEPHEFVLFYWPWDPAKYQQDKSLKWDFHSDWYWVDKFDKFEFKNDWEISKLIISPRTLLITSPNNYPKKDYVLQKTVKFLNQSPAFDIVSYD